MFCSTMQRFCSGVDQKLRLWGFYFSEKSNKKLLLETKKSDLMILTPHFFTMDVFMPCFGSTFFSALLRGFLF